MFASFTVAVSRAGKLLIFLYLFNLSEAAAEISTQRDSIYYQMILETKID